MNRGPPLGMEQKKKDAANKRKKVVKEASPTSPSQASSEREAQDSSDLDDDVFQSDFNRKKKSRKSDSCKDEPENKKRICAEMTPALVQALPKNLQKPRDLNYGSFCKYI